MGYPTPVARTKNWTTELLTDTDLEGQLDLIIDWINDAQNASSGHKHDGTTSEGPKIATLAATVTGSIAFSTLPTVPSAAPTSDTQITNKKYIDDQITALTIFETGMIILWSGSIVSIPSGWKLCDGNNSTPDLTNMFVYGAGDKADPGDSKVAISPIESGSGSAITRVTSSVPQGPAGSANGALVSQIDSMPSYYALAYIMKV